MPRHNWYEMGSYNMTCDQCGRVFKSTEMMLRWDNAWVDAACWEIRQPQDFVRGIPDNQSVPYARPRQLTSTTYLRLDPGGFAYGVSGPWQPFGTYFECIAHAALDDWTPTPFNFQVFYSNISGTTGLNFFVRVTTGFLSLVYSTDQGQQTVNSTAAPTVNNGEALYVRVTLSITPSAGTTTFYTSTDGETWTQLGAVQMGLGGDRITTPGGFPIIGNISNDPSLALTSGKIYSIQVLGAPSGSERLNFDANDGAVDARQFQAGPLLFQLTDDASFELE